MGHAAQWKSDNKIMSGAGRRQRTLMGIARGRKKKEEERRNTRTLIILEDGEMKLLVGGCRPGTGRELKVWQRTMESVRV